MKRLLWILLVAAVTLPVADAYGRSNDEDDRHGQRTEREQFNREGLFSDFAAELPCELDRANVKSGASVSRAADRSESRSNRGGI